LDIDGVRISVVRPEDLVIYKTVAWRPQDQQDVERLLLNHGSGIDLGRVRRVLAEFADALDQPERLAEFERLVKRLGL
jgi:predicted nucleotidyltransferase